MSAASRPAEPVSLVERARAAGVRVAAEGEAAFLVESQEPTVRGPYRLPRDGTRLGPCPCQAAGFGAACTHRAVAERALGGAYPLSEWAAIRGPRKDPPMANPTRVPAEPRQLVPLAPNRLLSGQPLKSLAELLEEARTYVASGLLPKAVDKPEKAVLIMATGRELGIGGLYALRNIHVIEGRPTCSAELMMALVQRDHGQGALRVAESTGERCVVHVVSAGQRGQFVWTLQDAERAGLLNKPVWKQYPRAMLRSRAVSEACRATFPGSIGGLYTPDELGAGVAVHEDGEITVIDPPARAALAEPAAERDDGATAGQVRAIHTHIARTGADAAGVRAAYGVEDLADLDRQSAARLLDDLTKRPNAPPARLTTPEGDAVAVQLSPKQLASIRAHLQRTGIAEATILDECAVRTLDALDSTAAAGLIRDLMQRPDARPTPAADADPTDVPF